MLRVAWFKKEMRLFHGGRPSNIKELLGYEKHVLALQAFAHNPQLTFIDISLFGLTLTEGMADWGEPGTALISGDRAQLTCYISEEE